MTREQYIKRLLPMALVLIAVLVLAFSCSYTASNENIPEVDDPSKDFVTLGDLAIENQEMYNALIDSYGAKEVTRIVSKDVLSNGEKNYYELAVNDPEFSVEDEIAINTYAMTYAEAITFYTEDTLESMEQSFNNSLTYNGYETLDDYIEDLYLEHARELYTKDQLLINDTIIMNDIEAYYNNLYYDSACALVVRFNTLEEAYLALSDEGLIPTTTGLFSNDPTDAEVLEAYVNIYNKVNLTLDPLVMENGEIVCTDALTYSYEEMTTINPSLGSYIFTSLSTDVTYEETTPVEANPYVAVADIVVGTDTQFYMIYKLSGDDQNSLRQVYSDLSDEEYTEFLETPAIEEDTALVNEILELTADFLSTDSDVMAEITYDLFKEYELTVYDPYLRYIINTSYGEIEDNDGDTELAFTYVDTTGALVELTAQELFETMYHKSTLLIMNILNEKMALEDDDATELAITDANSAGVEAQVQEYKSTFLADGYISYGYSSQDMTWETFLYTAFGVRSETELYNAIITSAVVDAYKAGLYVSEDNQEIYYDLMVDYYDNSFSVDLQHILVYIDMDNDGVPDLNEDSYTAVQIELANDLVNDLRIVLDLMTETEEITTESLQTIVDNYNSSSYDENESMWAKYKQYGLRLQTEDLGTVTQGQMVEAFENEARDMFEEMVDNQLFYLVSEENISTQFGYHLIYASGYTERGDAYPEDGALVFPSRNEITTFNNQEFTEVSSSVIIFIGQYYTPAQDEYLATNSVVMLDEARAEYGVPEFTQIDLTDFYNAVQEINIELTK